MIVRLWTVYGPVVLRVALNRVKWWNTRVSLCTANKDKYPKHRTGSKEQSTTQQTANPAPINERITHPANKTSRWTNHWQPQITRPNQWTNHKSVNQKQTTIHPPNLLTANTRIKHRDLSEIDVSVQKRELERERRQTDRHWDRADQQTKHFDPVKLFNGAHGQNRQLTQFNKRLCRQEQAKWVTDLVKQNKKHTPKTRKG